jgi:hypothetical protein
MFNRFILIFFYFFLLSRFFSEKLKILPKGIDVINYPLFILLIILLIVNINKKPTADAGENSFLAKSFLVFTISFLISLLFNNVRILFASSILFYAGLMEGPVLFFALNKLSNNPLKLINQLNKYFLIILVINLCIIFFIDLPQFLITSNPDVISGTYGNNTYQFSMLLLICGGYLLGFNFIKKKKTFIVIISQLIILLVFYLSQFRAGLLFFMLAYIFMIGMLYGKNIILKFIPIGIAILILLSVIRFLAKSEQAVDELKFEDWIEILANPERFITLGKFKIYLNTLDMFRDYPQTLIIGTGPGNFLSRANYTFSYEILAKSKGVSQFISDMFGIEYPYFSDYHKYYVYNRIRPESVYGTWQLSNPYTSYLSALTEIGIFGGLAIIIIYFYIIIKSFKYLKIIRIKKPSFIPLSIALIGSSIYLFQLAFLENYWEQARVTLPVWLLFWAVKTAAYAPVENDQLKVMSDE